MKEQDKYGTITNNTSSEKSRAELPRWRCLLLIIGSNYHFNKVIILIPQQLDSREPIYELHTDMWEIAFATYQIDSKSEAYAPGASWRI